MEKKFTKLDGFVRKHSMTATHYDVYIPFVIEYPEDFIETFDVLRNASEIDTVTVHVNCCGGTCVTGIQIINEITACSAHVLTVLNGMAASMATFIVLAGNEIEIYPNSEFMIHFVSGGVEGKGHEIKANSDFMSRHYKRFFREQYKYFLTKKEIEKVIDGKDMWMDDKEVLKRLKVRIKKHNKKNKKNDKKEETLEENE